MDVYKDLINWVPQTVLCGILCLVAISTVRIVKFVVHKTYKEIMDMLKQIQERLSSNESRINNISEQFKDGLNDIKLQISGLVPFNQYHDFASEIKDELSTIREKIARLENR